MKMKKLGLLSVSLFVISVTVSGIWFFNENALSGKIVVPLSVILPLIGLIAAFKSKGYLKAIGITGNLFVLLFSIIIPVAASLLITEP